MSTFFDTKKLPLTDLGEGTTISNLAWHPKLQVLAVALKGGSPSVMAFSGEASHDNELEKGEILIKRSGDVSVSSMAWDNTNQKALVVGWSDGKVIIM